MVPASCMCSSCNSRAFLEFSPSKCSDWAAYLAKSWRNGVTNRSSSSNCDFQWSKVLRVLASLASSSSFSSRLKYWGPIRGFQEYLDWIPGFSHFLYWIIQKTQDINLYWGQLRPKYALNFHLQCLKSILVDFFLWGLLSIFWQLAKQLLNLLIGWFSLLLAILNCRLIILLKNIFKNGKFK